MPGLVGAVTVLGMVVVAPLGLSLLATPGVRALVRWWPFLGLLAGAALLLRPGPLAVALCVPYALACAAVTALAARRGLTRLTVTTREMAAAFAGVSLSVAAFGGLLPERSGVDEFLGFDRATLGLTAAHFHFAAFAAVLVAALAAYDSVTTVGAWAVPVGTAIVFAGFFLGNGVELAGAVVLTAGLLLTSYGLLRRRPHPLLLVTAVAIPLTMAFAIWWASGEALGFAHPTIREMAATHGIANSLGVALCGLLGWRRAGAEPL